MSGDEKGTCEHSLSTHPKAKTSRLLRSNSEVILEKRRRRRCVFFSGKTLGRTGKTCAFEATPVVRTNSSMVNRRPAPLSPSFPGYILVACMADCRPAPYLLSPRVYIITPTDARTPPSLPPFVPPSMPPPLPPSSNPCRPRVQPLPRRRVFTEKKYECRPPHPPVTFFAFLIFCFVPTPEVIR